MDDKLKERLIKRLQKIPKSESLENRKIALEDRLTQEEAKYWFRYKDAKEACNLAAKRIYGDFAVII